MKQLIFTIDPEQESGRLAAPTSEQLAHHADKWFLDIREFRAWEDARLFGDAPPTPLHTRIHRYQLSALMTDGEMLLLGMALNRDLDCLSNGLTQHSIEAAQRCLRLTFLDWHGDIPKERRQALFDAIFPDTQSVA